MGKSCKAMEKRLVKQQSPIFGKNKNFFRGFCIIGQIFSVSPHIQRYFYQYYHNLQAYSIDDDLHNCMSRGYKLFVYPFAEALKMCNFALVQINRAAVWKNNGSK